MTQSKELHLNLGHNLATACVMLLSASYFHDTARCLNTSLRRDSTNRDYETIMHESDTVNWGLFESAIKASRCKNHGVRQ